VESKLLLFDIDGTLLSTRGVPRLAMERVLQRRFTNFAYDNSYDYSGRTDWEIVEHLLDYADVEFPRNFESLKTIFHDFSIELETEINNGLNPHVYPGVYELLKNLDTHSGFNCGLLTGNIKVGARLKLEAANLFKYFPVGAFGDDAKERYKLAEIAIQRAKVYFGNNINKKNIWIIGDSIHDIRCAQKNNLRCLAVCTGLTSRTDLEKEKPEFMVDDFSDMNNVISILMRE